MTTIDRRDFLRFSGMGLSSLALAKLAGCESSEELVVADTGPALPRRLPASIMSASAADLDIELSVISGRLPTDMFGHVFITSPVPQPGGTHVFNGEAMLLRLDFGAAAVGFRSRMLRPPCWYLDQAATGTAHEFTNVGMARMSQALGFRSMPNTSPVVLGPGRLLAAVDASRPWEVDPVSMEVVTPMGRMAEWQAALPAGLFAGPFQPVFSLAHPFYDEHTGETIAVNFSLPFPGAPDHTALVRWDGSGAIETFPLVDPSGAPVKIEQSAHQLGVTADYILVMDTAFLPEAEQAIGQDVSRAQRPDTVLYLVRRADLTTSGSEVEARKIVIPRESAHIVADYDNPDGRITIHMAHLTATDLSEWLRADDVRADDGAQVRADLAGLFSGGTDRNSLGRYVIDATSAQVVESRIVDDDELTWATLYYMHRDQMPHARFENLYYASFGFSEEIVTRRVLDLYADYPHRVVPVDQLPFAQGRPGALLRLSVGDMQIADGYRTPPGRVLSSPQFVPRAGSSADTDGYLVCTMVSDDISWPGSSGDEVWIFDAADLARGPVCRLGAPELSFAFTIHTTWTAAIESRSAPYMVSAREDYGGAVESLPSDLQRVFVDEVYPRFGG